VNWDAVGAIGQMLGSVAVFITLAYLSIQVRHARDEVQRSVSHDRKDALRQLMISRANNKWLTEVLVKANDGLGIKPTGKFQITLMEQAGLNRAEAVALGQDLYAFWECQAEAIPYAQHFRAGERLAFDGALRNAYRSPLFSLWFDAARQYLDPDAVRYVENLLAQPSATS